MTKIVKHFIYVNLSRYLLYSAKRLNLEKVLRGEKNPVLATVGSTRHAKRYRLEFVHFVNE